MTTSFELRDSLDELVKRLGQYSRFPKYSLERRVDIFLVPFLEALVRAKFDPKSKLVAPEFPVLSDLRDRGPYANVTDDQLTRRTVNVDYLFHLPGRSGSAEWLFVELKTDDRSFDSDQADLYAIARLRGMSKLRADLDFVCKKTDHLDKYDVLRDAIPAVGIGDRVSIAYLAPRALEKRACAHEYPATEAQKDLCRTATPTRTVDHFLALEDLRDDPPTNAIDPEFAPLWPTVKDLLDAILPRVART